jgi:hypothetical protein
MDNYYEKLGAFYLGKEYDPASRTLKENIVLYDSKDLNTHAVIIGMTGSGKTGLGISLLEEALIDKIPIIAIDPKGDLTNLLLNFLELKAEDFRPWINEQDALNNGLTPEKYAAGQAQMWQKGLASWDQGPERIARLNAAAQFAVYTPGSSAGLGVSVLRNFAPPPPAIMDDPDLLQERIQTTATGLLALLGIEADPVASREHILLANLFENAWKQGRALDLAGLIHAVQAPPFERIGVMDLEFFYPAKDRLALAMRMNGLLAAPGFESWMEGEPLDIGRFLYTPQGNPRASIFTISHLSDAQRMFFVSMLLNEILGWIRTQPGTSSLRAILRNRLMRAQQTIDREAEQSRSRKIQTAVSFGTAILGAFLGRKAVSVGSASRVGTAMRSASRMRKEEMDVDRAREKAAAIEAQLLDMEARMQEDIEKIEFSYDPEFEELEKIRVKPKAKDITLEVFGPAWIPFRRDAEGRLTPDWG